jgi:hypothetical protein
VTLTKTQHDLLFAAFINSNRGQQPPQLLATLFDVLLLAPVDQRATMQGWIQNAVLARQNTLSSIDAETTAAKTTLQQQITDLNSIGP